MKETPTAGPGDLDARIKKLRGGIDAIDDHILELINRRMQLARDIGRAKAEKGGQVFDSAREEMIFQRLFKANSGPLDNNMLRSIFRQIMASSRGLQTSQRVACLGPEATFTHIAAMNHFGEGANFLPQPSIRDVFDDVEKEGCEFGVVPVENSIEGVVNHTLDLFYESELKICAEIFQPIFHDLAANAAGLKDIRVIHSHPQAFAQCRRWLNKYLPDVELRECSSTAEAARQAARHPGTAAIASREAAALYKLEVIASRIEDIPKNTTRFLVIGKDAARRTGADKTSILFVTAHVPGALYNVLKPIAEAGVNMLKLESRPTRHQNWSYFFMVDLAGHVEDAEVKRTIDEMKKICLYLKFLGSYPMAAENEDGEAL